MRSKKRNSCMNELAGDRKLWSKHRISDPGIVELEKLGMITEFRG